VVEIVTLTLNPAVDLSTAVEQVVDTHKLRCDAARRYPGGGGINVARVIQRLDGREASCLALYLAGGSSGNLLEQMLTAERVTSRRLRIAGETREIAAGTHGRRGFRRALLGSVAEQFARLAHCSLLLVRGKDE
jgi:6-phosphofructokinase 2